MKKFYLLFASAMFLCFASNAQVVINEVYGGGGNSGAAYTNDFVELYNNSSSAVTMTNWSIQYTSAGGSSWGSNKTIFSGTIPDHGYFLIQLASTAAVGATMPVADATGTINMSATAGKLVLCNNSTTVSLVVNPTDINIVDKVGYGSAATGFETAPAPAPSNANSIQRKIGGPTVQDTNDNSSDFTAGAPSPTNSTGGVDVTPPTISSLFPANSATNVITSFTATITFSETVQKGASGTIIVKKLSDNSIVQTVNITSATVTVSGSSVSFDVSSLNFNTTYYVEISSASFKDLSNNDFAGIAGSSTWDFTTASIPPAGIVGTIYNFNTCSSSLQDGFTQYNVLGDQKWGCTSFGVDGTHSATGSAANGLQINGFLVTNIPNEDWLITPAFDLSSTTYPLLSFWSRTAFNGAPLQLKVSTDYPGTGDPRNYTWTDLNGKFPNQTSDVWTVSDNINLASFKSTHTFIAFVYTSTNDDGARWTLDDIKIDNSLTPPPPSLTLNTTSIQFGFAASGGNADKTFIVTGNDITGDITLTASSNFSLSANSGGPFGSSITLLQASANNIPTTVYVRFSPNQNNQNFTGTTTVSTPGVNDTTINLKGTSIDPATTLEVVNWNMEWFGSVDPTLGPSNNDLQQQNAETVLKSIGADLYGLVEVVDESRLATIVGNMPGYAYVICNYGSHSNPNDPNYLTGDIQKEAFVYKTSVFSNVTTTPLLSQGINSTADVTSNPAYNYFSSGRFPFMMTANVTLNGVTKTVRFVLLHAKANTSPTATSYTRRKAGADTLHYTLNTLYPNDNIVVLGDFNDDLDQSITAGQTVTSYSAFTTDNTNFFSPTLALSNAGEKSTVKFNDVIDHVVVSNEMAPYYMSSSADILSDVTSLVSNYGSTTSDHYPVFTRYTFTAASSLPVKLITFNAAKDRNNVKLAWSTSEEVNANKFLIESSTDGRTFGNIGQVNAAGNSSSVMNYGFTDAKPNAGNNYYRLRIIDRDGKWELSKVLKIDFSKTFTLSISPNPATAKINVSVTNISGPLLLQIVNMNGKIMQSQTLTSQNTLVNVSSLSKGFYIVQIKGAKESYNEKLVIE